MAAASARLHDTWTTELHSSEARVKSAAKLDSPYSAGGWNSAAAAAVVVVVREIRGNDGARSSDARKVHDRNNCSRFQCK